MACERRPIGARLFKSLLFFSFTSSLMFAGLTAEANDKVLTAAKDAHLRGRYAQSTRLASSISDKNIEAKLLLVRLKIIGGDLSGADKLLKSISSTEAETVGQALVLRGDLERRQGRHKAALRAWKSAVEEDPEQRGATLARGALLLELGRRGEGTKLLDSLAEDFNNGLLQDSEGLNIVGRAVWLLQYYSEANETLQEATEAEKENLEAWTGWGELFLEKYNTDDARFAFESALKVNPNLPGALVGMANLHLETDRDAVVINAYVERALAVDPTNPDAIVVKAILQIDVEDYDGAIVTLKDALKTNKNHFKALNLLATCFYLKDDSAAFKREIRRAFSLNPKWAGFYNVVARFAVRVHRYQEAIDFNKKSLKIDPDYWPAFVDLGIGYTRIGDDKKGFEFLLKAHENDGFNVRAFNMVNLYEKAMPKYGFVERDSLRFRFHEDERDVLELLVPPLAEEAFEALSKKYAYKPLERVSIEVFRDAQDFSVRSVGLPNISPHGICFGRVVTSRSPSESPFNWAEVIWHELSHVFHIQMSRSRVPRWFTEGLAEFEAGQARAEWRRERERELLVLYKQGRLYSVRNLNRGFTQARSIHEIISTYFQSTLVIEFIVDRWGFEVIPKMLRLYGRSKSTDEVMTATIKLGVDAFDEAFMEYIGDRFKGMLSTFDPNLASYMDLPRFEREAAARPKSADALASLGAALFAVGRLDEAEERTKEALDIDAEHPLAHYLESIFAIRIKKYALARSHLEKIVKGGKDGYTIRLQLGVATRSEGLVERAIEHYKRAVDFYPRGVDAHRALGDLYLKRGQRNRAADALHQVILLDQSDHATAQRLVALRIELGQPLMARDAAEMAVNINPFNRGLHRSLAELSLETGSPRVSVRSYELALLLLPKAEVEVRLELLLGLCRALYEYGDRAGALEALRRAEELKPESAEVRALRKDIR